MQKAAVHPTNRLSKACGIQQRRLVDVLGIAYVVSTSCLSFAALWVLSAYLANDTLWPDFDAVSPVVSTLFNLELATAPLDNTFDIFNARYALSDPSIGVQPAFPRQLMLQSWTDLPEVIRGLRLMSAADTNNLVTLYCWADLGREWEMAYTVKRQARCDATMTSNAAVYLEVVLRNVDLHGWIAINLDAFTVRIGEPIASTSPNGRTWLDALLQHDVVAVDTEVALWQRHGIQLFRLQVANWHLPGAIESISVQNALGTTSLHQLKSVSTTNNFFYTMVCLNELLYQDVLALSANQSLVRNTTNYFDDVTVLQNYILGIALSPLNLVFVATVGNFGNVDAWWIPPPASLVDSVRAFRAAALDHMLLDSDFANAVNAIGSTTLPVTPAQWADPALAFYGGSLLCATAPLLPQVQESFNYYAACGSQNPLAVPWNPWNSLFAFSAALPSNDDLCNQGASPKQVGECQAQLQATVKAFHMLPVRPIPPPATPPLTTIGISQIVANGSDVSLQIQRLLDPSYAFFGWMSLYDWAMGQREVFAVEGDFATLYIISPLYPAVAQALPSAVAAYAPYVGYLSAVVSGVLAAVALMVLGLWVCARPRTTHWFLFNRLVSSVWLGRSVLVLRGLGAAAALGTAPLATRTSNGVVHLVAAPRHPVVSLALAGETTWLVYVVQELLSPVTRPTWAPVASAAAWLVVALLDVLAPIRITAKVHRECEILDINTRIRCTGGSLTVGAVARTATIAAVCGTVALVSMIRFRSQRTKHHSLLLPATAVAFLPESSLPLDVATMAMCGVFVAPGDRGFDTKLWRVLQGAAYVDVVEKAIQHPGNQAAFAPIGPVIGVKRSGSRIQSRLRWATVVAGVLYLCATLTSNVAYVRVLQEALANDFGWPGFNTTGMYAFLANTFNHEIMLSTNNSVLAVASPAYADVSRMYNGTDLTVSWSAGAVRRLLYDPRHIILTEVIVGLRRTDACQLPWMFTQYCWLDFGRQWGMASTEARQRRCTRQLDNGAVYLEAGLRNVNDWGAWHTCWGDAFSKAIQEPLAATTSGRLWLAALSTATASVADELEIWSTNGIQRFVLQWQNYKSTAFFDTIVITSALGLQYALPISSATGGMHLDAQTSLRLYWAWANDLLAVNDNSSAIAGRSLLRGTADFAFANVTSQSLLQAAQLLPSPLSAGLTLFTRAVGPFGVVDAVYVPCPPVLLTYYREFTQTLAMLLLTDALMQSSYKAIAIPAYIGDVPVELLSTPNLTLTGGNLLCGDDAVPTPLLYVVYAGFGSEQLCFTATPEFVAPSTLQLMFTMHGYSSHHVLSRDELIGICSINPIYVPSCADMYAAAMDIIVTQPSLLTLTPLARAAHAAVMNLGVTTVQYIRLNNSVTKLMETPLFDAAGSYGDMNGWYLAYEWAVGLREVVSFQGDVGTVTTLSASNSLLSMSLDTSLVGSNLSFLFMASVLYITYILIGVSAVATGYAISSHGRIEGLNLLELNRIVGHSWVGRPLLILRSVTALWLLNTAPLALTQIGLGTQLTAPPVAWYKTALAASELTWTVYILNDVLSCITKQHTSSYAMASTLCTWLATAVWTFAAPHKCRVAVERACTYIDMDSGLTCSSGVVEVGSICGVLGDIGIVIGCVIICAYVDVRCRSGLPPMTLSTLLLNASSYYMLDFTHWHRDDEHYMDQASGALAGLLSLHWRGTLYILDVKSWRCITATTCGNPEGSLCKAIPLSRLG
ncbi:hypothetical protein ACHHYP_14299 [Achlya hypogyna]|uniref:Transmembrane protein n=1 Tax=Achlya hypogyna TaxID=1202772 RepID=A0A1V9YDK4_ACHHY|nr:hypothetical protein ACHHYP_14299 [Achlya hypogyna]